MRVKFIKKAPIILLTVVFAPIIAAYCLVWAAMGIGGGAVKRILKKDTA